MAWRIEISISESDFDFQIFILPRITQCRIGLYNLMLIIMSICYIPYLTLYIYGALHIISHNHFTFFLINIVTLYTFFNEFIQHFTHFSRQFYAEYRTKARYAFRYLMHWIAFCCASILHLITFCSIYILHIF